MLAWSPVEQLIHVAMILYLGNNLVSQAIFSAQTMHVSAIIFYYFSDLRTFNSCLFGKGCICFCLCLPNVGLVSPARPFLFHNRFQYSYLMYVISVAMEMEGGLTDCSDKSKTWQIAKATKHPRKCCMSSEMLKRNSLPSIAVHTLWRLLPW